MIAHKERNTGPLPEDRSESTHLLLVSIGNTRVGVASWVDGRRGVAQHLPVDGLEAVEEAFSLWKSFGSGPKRAVVVSSVNPPRLKEFRDACADRGMGPLLVVGYNLDPPLPVAVREPEQVGSDRLCAAAAAYARMRCACVVADFGTAVTIDLVADDGAFLGGTILPGMALSARALHEHTAQLPLVDVGQPTDTLGKDTASAIRNGISAMMAGALREITERYATEIGKWPPLVVTGGDAEAVARACDFVDRVVPDLALDGLAVAYRRAFESQES